MKVFATDKLRVKTEVATKLTSKPYVHDRLIAIVIARRIGRPTLAKLRPISSKTTAIVDTIITG